MGSIILNGNKHELSNGKTVTELLESLGWPRAATAVAVNESIIPKEKHETFLIKDGDRVEVIRPIGGG